MLVVDESCCSLAFMSRISDLPFIAAACIQSATKFPNSKETIEGGLFGRHYPARE
jgi:hypothetical protein